MTPDAVTPDATIPADDRSYLYGDGLFETVRVRPDGSIRWLDAHIARLENSGAALGFAPETIAKATHALRSLPGRAPGIWRVTMSRPGIGPDGNPVPFGGTGGVTTRFRPYHPPARPRLGLAERLYLPDDVLAEHKTTSFLRNIEARRRAQLAGFDDAIMLSIDGLAGEASAANIVVILKGRALTPPVLGLLPGVTRQGVRALARAAGEPVEEREITRQMLLDADEIALLSAGVGILAAATLLGRTLDDRWTRRAAAWLM